MMSSTVADEALRALARLEEIKERNRRYAARRRDEARQAQEESQLIQMDSRYRKYQTDFPNIAARHYLTLNREFVSFNGESSIATLKIVSRNRIAR